MGLLNDIVSTVASGFNGFTKFVNKVEETLIPVDWLSNNAGKTISNLDPFGEVAGVLVETVTEDILAPIEQTGELTPDNVEKILKESEGNAAEMLFGMIAFAGVLEDADLGLTEAPSSILADAIVGLEVPNLLGREVKARLQEGIDPALKQMVHADHRSKQADYRDWVTANGRIKNIIGLAKEAEGIGTDERPDRAFFEKFGFPTRGGKVPDKVKQIYNKRDFGWLPDPDTYGTIPEQTELYEFDALRGIEPRELIEYPPGYGITPAKSTLLQAMQEDSFSEDVKSTFLRVIDNIAKEEKLTGGFARFINADYRIAQAIMDGRMEPKRATVLYEQNLQELMKTSIPEERIQEWNNTLDDWVSEGFITQDEADEFYDKDRKTLIEEAVNEVRERHKLMGEISNPPPTTGQITRWWREGIISTQRFKVLLADHDTQSEFFFFYLLDEAVRVSESDVVKQHRLGRLSAKQAMLRFTLKGYTPEQGARLLAGASPDQVLQPQGQQGQNVGALPASTLVVISVADEALMSQVGLGTVADVAQANVKDVATGAGTTDAKAKQAIEQAKQLLKLAQQAG